MIMVVWRHLLYGGVVALIVASSNAATTYCVRSTGSDAAAGTNWATALATVTQALAKAVSGDEIWVAQGTYVPGTARTDSFVMKSGVSLYGGFTNGMADFSQRDPAALACLEEDHADVTVARVWREHRLTCLKRSTLGSYLLGVLDEWKVSGHPDKLAVVDYVRRNKDMLEDEAAEENVVDYGDIPF